MAGATWVKVAGLSVGDEIAVTAKPGSPAKGLSDASGMAMGRVPPADPIIGQQKPISNQQSDTHASQHNRIHSIVSFFGFRDNRPNDRDQEENNGYNPHPSSSWRKEMTYKAGPKTI
jgi:hypothetical protein